MAMTQWSPLSEFVTLREAMDRLFNESMVRPNGSLGRPVAAQPYDLYETEDALTFRFATPGVRPEDVDVTVHQNILTVRGSYPQEEETQGWTWHARGLPRNGQFQYSFQLPAPVNVDQANASFENGILTLTLPKAETAKPKRIQIAAPAGAQSAG